jgi:hypothetical protein
MMSSACCVAHLQVYTRAAVAAAALVTGIDAPLIAAAAAAAAAAATAPLQVYTREYVSPEVAQAVVGGAVSIVAQPSWDLWGIGIIMWEMATGGNMICFL